ncbi:dTDP-4-dehydrorhamnose 3,5-epimerase [Alphaproteobacteria bacterium]|nr:dTDP-4-dehydrorhamnose 3,5-epimerase [Alphaproteobacteria bacterium]
MATFKSQNCVLIVSKRHEDHRGFFAETYNKKEYQELGINDVFVQDNHSVSAESGTLRGLHFQAPPSGQAKLVRCGRGALFDVVVDIRNGSPTFGQWEGYELSERNGHQLYVPIGFAHGFISLEPHTEIVYKCSAYYDPLAEGGLHWSDRKIGITWPLNGEPIVSDKDTKAPTLEELNSPFHYGVNS